MLVESKKRSGISGERAYRIQKEMISRLRDIMANAKSFTYPTHEQLGTKVYAEVFNTENAKRLPAHIREYVRGYYDALRENIFAEHTVWVHSIDGAFYTTEEREELSRREAGNIKLLVATSAEMRKSISFPKEVLDLEPHVIAGTYKEPLCRIDTDKSCYVWKDTKGNPVKNKKYM